MENKNTNSPNSNSELINKELIKFESLTKNFLNSFQELLKENIKTIKNLNNIDDQQKNKDQKNINDVVLDAMLGRSRNFEGITPNYKSNIYHLDENKKFIKKLHNFQRSINAAYKETHEYTIDTYGVKGKKVLNTLERLKELSLNPNRLGNIFDENGTLISTKESAEAKVEEYSKALKEYQDSIISAQNDINSNVSLNKEKGEKNNETK